MFKNEVRITHSIHNSFIYTNHVVSDERILSKQLLFYKDTCTSHIVSDERIRSKHLIFYKSLVCHKKILSIHLLKCWKDTWQALVIL